MPMWCSIIKNDHRVEDFYSETLEIFKNSTLKILSSFFPDSRKSKHMRIATNLRRSPLEMILQLAMMRASTLRTAITPWMMTTTTTLKTTTSTHILPITTIMKGTRAMSLTKTDSLTLRNPGCLVSLHGHSPAWWPYRRVSLGQVLALWHSTAWWLHHRDYQGQLLALWHSTAKRPYRQVSQGRVLPPWHSTAWRPYHQNNQDRVLATWHHTARRPYSPDSQGWVLALWHSSRLVKHVECE